MLSTLDARAVLIPSPCCSFLPPTVCREQQQQQAQAQACGGIFTSASRSFRRHTAQFVQGHCSRATADQSLQRNLFPHLHLHRLCPSRPRRRRLPRSCLVSLRRSRTSQLSRSLVRTAPISSPRSPCPKPYLLRSVIVPRTPCDTASSPHTSVIPLARQG